jgi:putative oxidoreductase
MIKLIAKFYRLLIRSGVFIAPVALLIVRLAWGWESFESGRGHLTHLDQTTQFFQSLNIPQPKLNAVVSGTTEMVGGILLMAGLAARLVAIPLTVNFIVAIVTDAHDQLIHVFSAPDKLVDYTAFPFLVASLVILAFGPGVISIDGLLKHTVFRKQIQQASSPVVQK